MKKIFSLLCLLFISLFFINMDTKAFSYPSNPECETVTKNGKDAQKCKIKFNTSSTWYLDTLTVKFTLTNATMDVTESTISDDYNTTYDSESNKIILKTNKNAFPMGTYTIGEFYYYKINSEQECYVTYSISPKSVVRTCMYDEINKLYYDKNGDITNELDYTKQCLKNICTILPDGTYYGKNGTVVTKEVYENDCLEKKYCEIVDNKYYGKDGNEISKTEYQKQCERNYCKIIDNTYFGKDGNEVSKEVYENECLERYICTINNGKYYGKDGKEITELEYQKQCEKNVCTILSDGTIYDKDGNITDETTYKKQCEKHNCEIIDDTYYDKDGNVIDEKTYNLVCKTHKCEKVEDKYFDANGNIVDEETYNKNCTTIDNPQTGNILSILYLILGIGVGGLLLYVSRKNKKIRN